MIRRLDTDHHGPLPGSNKFKPGELAKLLTGVYFHKKGEVGMVLGYSSTQHGWNAQLYNVLFKKEIVEVWYDEIENIATTDSDDDDDDNNNNSF